MALGKRDREQEQTLWIAGPDLIKSPGHPFYQRLNRMLAEGKFDDFVEELCAPYYAEMGRPSIPPGIYFRMLFVGYFEGLDSNRAIAWRCADSLSLRDFLGLEPTKPSPNHSSLTVIRQRLPLKVHERVFSKILSMAQHKKLLKGRSVAVDATTVEANAAMKSLVRRDTGESYRAYLKRLAEEDGIEDPSDDDLKKFDKKRRGKKMSNTDWTAPSDPDSRITKMKDGRTHLAYKAEHVLDLDSQLLLSANVYGADAADSETLGASLSSARSHLETLDNAATIREVVADRGYHKIEKLAEWNDKETRTYIPEQRWRHDHNWENWTEEERRAYELNRRRCQGKRGKKLQRLRRERIERSVTHVCDTGGGRRSWIGGLVEVGKDYLVRAAGFNLGVMMRALCGVGSPRGLQSGRLRALLRSLVALYRAIRHHSGLVIALIVQFPFLMSRHHHPVADSPIDLQSA